MALQGLRPDAPPYAMHGPYSVGARDFVISDGENTVFITVWYPALNPTQKEEEIVYEINTTLPSIKSFWYPALATDQVGIIVKGRALQDATPDTAHGPFPLVIFSPGLGGWRQANSFMLEHLASHGFVAIAWDPRGETFQEFWAGAATRPIDTKLTIAYADKLTAPDGALAKLIDMEQIAVIGHSSGGWTALIGGGAQMDFSWCAANADIVAQNEMSNCTQFVAHEQEIAAMLGLQLAPIGRWPSLHDRRVMAVVALAPDGDIWGSDYGGVAVMTTPTLIMTGSKDPLNVPERTAYPIYEQLGSTKKSLVVFENAGHMIFFNQCRNMPWLIDGHYWACSDQVWEMDRAHDLINHFVTAFLLAELKGEATAINTLKPANVTFPGIGYQTTAYQ